MTKSRHHGFSMIEVLVTIVILMIGLLGLAGLQARALSSQMESYQRSQALLLLKDMAGRINANRLNVGLYFDNDNALGTGAVCPAATGNPIVDDDLCDWHNALLGSAEQSNGTNVGAMIGARGCIYEIAAADPLLGVAGEYVVVVAWQGMNVTAAPDVSTATSPGQCGKDQYKDKDGNVEEKLHRVISLPINIATLSAP